MKRHFCTLFDSNYLLKGFAMLTSLQQHCPEARVYVLCLDSLAQEILEASNLDGVVCIPLSQIEGPELLNVKQQRNIAEYCWTLSSCFTAWLMHFRDEIEALTYLDSDLMFFSSIEPIFQEIANASVAIIEHRFTSRLKHLENKGRFCVEWVSFRRDVQGLACLNHWRDQCLEWCYDRLEDGRMGDQKYLDAWPELYSNTHIIRHPGAGLAPWNYPNYQIASSANGAISVDGQPLIFFHFHQFQLIEDRTYYRMSPYYAHEIPPPEAIYLQYEAAMDVAVDRVRALKAGFNHGFKSAALVNSRRLVQKYVPRAVKEFLKRHIRY
jgi:hypothetical protein